MEQDFDPREEAFEYVWEAWTNEKYNMQEYKTKCAQFNIDDELCL